MKDKVMDNRKGRLTSDEMRDAQSVATEKRKDWLSGGSVMVPPEPADKVEVKPVPPVVVSLGLPAFRQLIAGEHVEVGGVVVRATNGLVDAATELDAAIAAIEHQPRRPNRPDQRERLAVAVRVLVGKRDVA